MILYLPQIIHNFYVSMYLYLWSYATSAYNVSHKSHRVFNSTKQKKPLCLTCSLSDSTSNIG